MRILGARLDPGDAAGGPLGQFMLAEDGEEASRAPALLVGTCPEVLPETSDGRHSELGEHQRQLGGVGHGGICGCGAAAIRRS